MSKENVVVKSGIWYTLSNFITKGMIFLATPIFTRLLTQEEFGTFSTFSSWLNIFIIVVSLNIESTLMSAKYDFEKRFDEYIFSSLTLSTISTIVWAVVFNGFMNKLSDFIEVEPLYINCMFAYLLFYPALTLFQVKERYMYRYKSSVFVSALVSVGSLLLSILLVKIMENQLSGRVLGHVLPTILVGGALYVLLGIKGKKVSVSDWKYALKICLPYIPHLLSMMILSSTDKIMITKMCGTADTALYSVAYSVVMVISVLLTSLNGAFCPWLAEKLSAQDFNATRKASKIYIVLFMCFYMGFILLTPEILLIMGGKAYMQAKAVMIPVAMGCVCQFLYTLFVNVEQFHKKTIGMAFASISAAVINYVLNLWLIPKFGYVAAAYTTLIGYLWLLLVHMILVWIMRKNKVYSYKFVLASVVVAGIIAVVANVLYSNVVVRYIFLGVYGISILVLLWKYRAKLFSALKK